MRVRLPGANRHGWHAGCYSIRRTRCKILRVAAAFARGHAVCWIPRFSPGGQPNCGPILRPQEQAMHVSHLVKRDVVTAAPGDSIDKAISLMEERAIHHLVVESNRRINGMLSDRDILLSTGWMLTAERRIDTGHGSEVIGPTRIEQIMSRPAPLSPSARTGQRGPRVGGDHLGSRRAASAGLVLCAGDGGRGGGGAAVRRAALGGGHYALSGSDDRASRATARGTASHARAAHSLVAGGRLGPADRDHHADRLRQVIAREELL